MNTQHQNVTVTVNFVGGENGSRTFSAGQTVGQIIDALEEVVGTEVTVLYNRTPIRGEMGETQVKEGDEFIVAPRRSNGTGDDGQSQTLSVKFIRAGAEQTVHVVPNGTTLGELFDFLAAEGGLDVAEVSLVYSSQGRVSVGPSVDFGAPVHDGDQLIATPRRSNG